MLVSHEKVPLRRAARRHRRPAPAAGSAAVRHARVDAQVRRAERRRAVRARQAWVRAAQRHEARRPAARRVAHAVARTSGRAVCVSRAAACARLRITSRNAVQRSVLSANWCRHAHLEPKHTHRHRHHCYTTQTCARHTSSGSRAPSPATHLRVGASSCVAQRARQAITSCRARTRAARTPARSLKFSAKNTPPLATRCANQSKTDTHTHTHTVVAAFGALGRQRGAELPVRPVRELTRWAQICAGNFYLRATAVRGLRPAARVGARGDWRHVRRRACSWPRW